MFETQNQPCFLSHQSAYNLSLIHIYGSLVPPATRYSTLQDLDAGRRTEIDMFSGALRRMGQELGIPTPYNEYTYHMIKALEEKNDGLFDYAAKASDLTCAK